MEKERCCGAKPGLLFFRINNRIMLNKEILLKCLITDVDLRAGVWPLLSMWRGDREVRLLDFLNSMAYRFLRNDKLLIWIVGSNGAVAPLRETYPLCAFA
jgi:hypothetical protein